MRRRGSRRTAYSCSCSKRPSRRAWLSRCLQTPYAYTTRPSSPCRTCSRGLTTRPRSPASRPWRRPASEPACSAPRDPAPRQGGHGGLRARTLSHPSRFRLHAGREHCAPAHRVRAGVLYLVEKKGRARQTGTFSQMPMRLGPTGAVQSPLSLCPFYYDF